MNFIKSYGIPLFLVILGLIFLSIPMYKRHVKHQTEAFQEQRRSAIKKGVAEIFKDCPAANGFDARRECFKVRMVEMRKNNSQVRLKYKMLINGEEKELETEDLGDLLLIKKDAKMSFTRCVSNTFFLDWNSDKIYISLENTLGAITCTLPQGGDIYIVPSNLSTTELLAVKQALKIPIR